MHCPKCSTENREEARFCGNCGVSLRIFCPGCGTELIPELRFCDACGRELAARPLAHVEASGPPNVDQAIQRLVPKEYAERLLAAGGQMSRERRTVTMLFCDVKGSTAMAESRDPEDVMEIMDGAFDVLIEPVYRYEGTLARLMGDAILAFFGAPIAHEDDPEQACRAALEIVAGVRRYAARLEEERGIRGFDVRVGIHTGLVVVGEVGSDLRAEYTAMGDAVNLAARLESAAEPGTVLVSQDTQRLIAPMFETAVLDPIEVKGRSQPVPVYRVLAARELPGKPRGIPGLESPLVGREAEFAALQEALERVEGGKGGIVTLVGEAGIGKSRLVAEVHKGAPHLRWVEGRCLSYGSSIAYLLWLDLLRRLLGVTVRDAPKDVGTVLRMQVETLCSNQFEEVYPYLAAMMSVPPETEAKARLSQLGGQELKAGTFRAVESLLASTASQGPLVLVGEDLHWADPTSVELLEKLLPLTERVALLIVCTFRPVSDCGAWRLRDKAERDHARRYTGLRLEPLSAAQSERLVGNLLWLEELPEELKGRILERAEGNPFYLEEVLRSLISEGAIEQEETTGRWMATRDVSDIAIPDTLQGVLLARIDRLQEETKRVLQMAAVIGRVFLCRVLAQLAYEERDLEGDLQVLQQEELVRVLARQPYLEYIFKHELTREAAYNGLLKKERRVFHRRVAETLERLYPDRLEEQVGLLAYHWERAGDAEKATEYLLQAGDQARLVYAHEEAVDYYQRALVFLEEMEAYDRAARTQMKLGLTYDTAFDFQRSRQAYDKGFALWQRVGQKRPAVPLQPAPHALRLACPDPVTLDPTLVFDQLSSIIVHQLFAGLVAHTPDLGIVPDLAKSWEVSHGGRQYLFHLRDDIVWSDSVPVTAYDVEYAWKRALDPVIASRNANLLYDVKGARAFNQGSIDDPDAVGVRATEDAVLVVNLEQPAGYFLHVLTHSVAYPVPRHVVEERGAAWAEPGLIVTTGPFTLASWQRGDSMVLVRYPHYHGRFGGNLQQVALSLEPVANTADISRIIQRYEAGFLDTVRPLLAALEEKDRIRHKYAGEYVSRPAASTNYLGFPVGQAPFDDPRLRRAFAHATDRKALPDVRLGGWASPVLGGFVPPGIPGHVPDLALPYDPERARRLLGEAGYPGGEEFPPVEWLSLLRGQAQAENLQAQWRETLGLETRWRVIPWHDFLDILGTDPPAPFLLDWIPDWPDPDSYLRIAVSIRAPSWSHGTYLALVDEARRAMDQNKRMRLYAQAERILADEVPILPLSYERSHMLLKPWVKRYPTSATFEQFWKDVVIEPHGS
jgi:ABC-type oligopeptide transport system substrate-binding subunit/class 3 adenylate cyclase